MDWGEELGQRESKCSSPGRGLVLHPWSPVRVERVCVGRGQRPPERSVLAVVLHLRAGGGGGRATALQLAVAHHHRAGLAEDLARGRGAGVPVEGLVRLVDDAEPRVERRVGGGVVAAELAKR